jgi:undecaprenyl diphosphate synthase
MSKDNFTKRSKKEIDFLTKLIHTEIQKFANDPVVKKQQINIKFYGAYEQYFDQKIINDLRQVEQKTANYKNCYVSILLVYNGKDELINGLKKIKSTKHITEKQIKNTL